MKRKTFARVVLILLSVAVYGALTIGLPYWSRNQPGSGPWVPWVLGSNWWHLSLCLFFGVPIVFGLIYLVGVFVGWAQE